MKKVILASVVAIAAVSSIGNANASAATVSVCSGAGVGISFSWSTNSGTDNDFVKQVFNGRCSNNVSLVGEDDGTYFRVGAASSKGKSQFGGSSIGGGVIPTATVCGTSGTACAVSDAAAGLNSALTG